MALLAEIQEVSFHAVSEIHPARHPGKSARAGFLLRASESQDPPEEDPLRRAGPAVLSAAHRPDDPLLGRPVLSSGWPGIRRRAGWAAPGEGDPALLLPRGPGASGHPL